MQFVQILQKLRAFFEIQSAAAVDEIFRQRGIFDEPPLRLVQIAQRGQIFCNILFRDGVRRSAHQPFDDGARFVRALPIAFLCDLAQLFRVHVDIDDRLKVLGIIGEPRVVKARRVVEHAELLFAHARKIFIVLSRQQPFGDFAQKTQLALGKG